MESVCGGKVFPEAVNKYRRPRPIPGLIDNITFWWQGLISIIIW